MTSVSWDDDDGDEEEEVKASGVRWKGRNLLNFAVGRSRVRALPVVIHFLPEDVDWFSSVSCPAAPRGGWVHDARKREEIGLLSFVCLVEPSPSRSSCKRRDVRILNSSVRMHSLPMNADCCRLLLCGLSAM